MTHSLLIAPMILTFISASARACGDGSGEPPPPPPPPELPVVVAPVPHEDREPVAPTVAIHYGYCCQVDGQARYSVALGRDPATALAQCQGRELRLTKLPDCPAHIANRLRSGDGGE